MKKYTIIFHILSLLFIMACSNETEITKDFQNDIIHLEPISKDNSVFSRAHSSTPLNMSYVVGIYNKDYNSSTLPLKVRSTATYASSSYTFSPVPRWDDVSADGYDVRTTGSVNIWAAQVAGRTYSNTTISGTPSNTNAIINDSGIITWIVTTDQTANGAVAKNDLMAADYISGQKATLSAIPLCFHHIMTKITINVIIGDGFVASDITSAAATLLSQNIQATVDLTKAKGDNSDTNMISGLGSTSDIKMGKLGTPNTGASVSFEAIVAPGKALTKTTKFATLALGKTSTNVNTYNVYITDAILAAWGLTTSDNTMKYSTHYILNATVNKGKITFTATTNDWKSGGTAQTIGEITFTADATEQGSSTSTAFTKAFTIYSSSTTSGYTAGTTFTYTAGTGYTTTSPIYWAHNNDNRYFRTALYESSTSNTVVPATISSDKVSGIIAEQYTESKDLIWGTSGSTIYKPTIKPTKLTFSHSLSHITVNLNTTTDNSSLDLTNVSKVEITNTKTTAGILSIHDGTVSTSATASTLLLAIGSTAATATSYNCSPYLVLPQTIPDTSKIIITMNDGSTYSVNLAAIHKAQTAAFGLGQTTAEWKQNEKYIYNVTLSKDDISFSASIKSWTTATGSGNAAMEWD